jgi:hypothetical protein
MKRVSLIMLGTLCAAIMWGCNDLTDPGSSPDGGSINAALSSDDLTSFPYSGSDWEGGSTASPSSGLAQFTENSGWSFRREITSSTRNVEMTVTDGTANVTIKEDRVGILHVRTPEGSDTEIERPFTDHGERQALLEQGPRGRWHVVSTSFMDRKATSVDNPIGIDYIEFEPLGGAAVRFDSATEMIERSEWPVIRPGAVVTVRVHLANLPTTGARVFLHDWFDHERHQVELAQDATDTSLFTLTWYSTPWRFGERLFRRLVTLDVLDAATLSSDPAATYNAHQWILPAMVTDYVGTRVAS